RISWFKSEFKVMADLHHPHIAAVYDFEPLQGTGDYFFTMDYVAGSDLLSASAGQPLERIVELMVGVCRALGYMHSRRVVHFAVKAGNVVVDEDGKVKVLDFGLVGAGKSGNLIGTPAYMAPELSRGAGIDHRADLYSLGIMFFQLVCRELPFSATSLLELLRMH